MTKTKLPEVGSKYNNKPEKHLHDPIEIHSIVFEKSGTWILRIDRAGNWLDRIPPEDFWLKYEELPPEEPAVKESLSTEGRTIYEADGKPRVPFLELNVRKITDKEEFINRWKGTKEFEDYKIRPADKEVEVAKEVVRDMLYRLLPGKIDDLVKHCREWERKVELFLIALDEQNKSKASEKIDMKKEHVEIVNINDSWNSPNQRIEKTGNVLVKYHDDEIGLLKCSAAQQKIFTERLDSPIKEWRTLTDFINHVEKELKIADLNNIIISSLVEKNDALEERVKKLEQAIEEICYN